MFLIFRPTLRLVHSLTFRFRVAIKVVVASLHQRRPADLHLFLDRGLLHAEVTTLLEGLFALLLLIGLVLGHIGRVAFLNTQSYNNTH